MEKKYLLFILVFAFLIRFAGIFWGKLYQDDFDLFQHDEFQHVEIGIRQIQEFDPGFLENYQFRFQPFNAHGLGSQIALLAYPISKIYPLKARHLLILGRLLSIFYSLLMICLIYKMAVFLFNLKNVGLLAAMLYAVFDLSITHGRYAIPAIGYNFWAYLGVFLLIKFYRKYSNTHLYNLKAKWWPGLLLGVSFGLVMSMKYDFIPFAVFSLLMVFIVFNIKKIPLQLPLFYLSVFGVAVFFFFASSLFQFSLSEFIESYSAIYRENKDVVAIDSHWLTNPVIYFFAVLAGSSVFVVSFFGYGIFQIIKQKARFLNGSRKVEVAILLVFLLMEFLIRWGIDTPFIRRANIFMPFGALLAGFGAWYFLEEIKFSTKRFRTTLVAFALIYTLGISLVSQYNFWNDPRYRAATYIDKHIEIPEKVYNAAYSQAVGMPKNTVGNGEEAGLIILHEAHYGRYIKSFTTPFILPESTEEVYHCYEGAQKMKFFQDLVLEKGDHKIVKKISGPEIFPERILFNYLFGSYEPFNGDVLILIKK